MAHTGNRATYSIHLDLGMSQTSVRSTNTSSSKFETWHTAQRTNQHTLWEHNVCVCVCLCGGRAELKPALERDLISPKTSHFSSCPPSLSLLIISLRLYLYSCSTSPIMDLAARCALLLSSFAVLAALDLDAIDPGYYVETSSPSDVIDYKDPCKAGEHERHLFTLL